VERGTSRFSACGKVLVRTFYNEKKEGEGGPSRLRKVNSQAVAMTHEISSSHRGRRRSCDLFDIKKKHLLVKGRVATIRTE